MQKTILTILFLISVFTTKSQDFKITGKVTDNKGQTLPGAGIALLQPNDSVIVFGTVSDGNGDFVFNMLPTGKFLLKISFLGYNDLYINKEITNQSLNLGTLSMKDNVSTLNEVNITEKIPPVQLKGDTTQYNADAFKTNRDATAEDLTSKMPGITSQDGKIQAQGEDVKKILIDGKPFLGDDPNAALKNLPAEIIEKIQVFDKKSDQSEFTGFNDGNTTKTINIITRPQFRNGTFGKTYAGYGTEELWKGGFNLNFFKDKRKLILLGNSNNINEQNFSTDDLLGVLGSSANNRPHGPRGNYPQRGGGGGGRYQSQNDAGNFLVDQKNGTSTTNSVGLNYVNQWKKLDFSMSYFFNHSDNRASSNIYRQYFTTDSEGLIYNEDNITLTENLNHRANLRLEYKFDTLNSILFQPRVSFQNNTGQNSLIGNNTDLNGIVSKVLSTSNNDLNGLSFSSPILYRHSFSKKGRTFSANVNTGYNQNKGNGDLNSLITYYSDSLSLDTMNQISDQNSHTWNNSAELIYTEPVGEFCQLSFNYKGSYTSNVSDKNTFTFSPPENLYNTLDTPLSNKFNSNYITQSFGPNYRIQNEKWNLMAGISFQRADLSNENIFPYENKLDKQFNSILPVAMIQYKFSKLKNIRLFYRSSNNSPSITQLQNVVNNSNPLQLSIGNPDLKQDWQNNVNIRYSATNPEKSTSFFVFLSGTVTNNYIGNSTIIASSDTIIINDFLLSNGSQLSMPKNLSENYNLRFFGNFSIPLAILKSSLNVNANANYSRTPGLINNNLTHSTTTGSGLGFTLSSNISEKIDFLFSSNGSLNNIVNTVDENLNNKSFNLTSRFKFQLMPWKGLVIQTDLNHQSNSGLSEDFNQNYFLWNAAVGYKFLKNKLAELRLSVFDILKQNISISRNTTDIYYEDTQSNVLKQYFMLTFTYNIKLFKAKKEN